MSQAERTTDHIGVISGEAASTRTSPLSGTIAPPAGVELTAREHGRVTNVSCRALDVVGAGLGLLLLSPALIAIAVAVRLDSDGRALYRQTRFGRGLRPFTVNKFRTMHRDASYEEHRAFVQRLIAGDAEQHCSVDDVALFKLAGDPRVTRFGRFLRRSSLDELPQLINVLKGDMSLVGPRPPVEYEVERYPDHAFGRFAVKPGITGLWQTGGRSEVAFEEMIALDLDYVERRSLWLNVKVLLRTVPVVLQRKGAA
ncbi:MAG TPA: sugar transferase [Solirubrobacteraceae bacterium]|jgi:lipopolysaccharide/colanic/teichoic acid biosynthesis glycosyltransferase|nr:sugar transferase [Solirubrobacteraceae bacterium]